MGSGGTEWDTADVLTKARLNQKNIFVGTGTQINALTAFAGQHAYCITSGSGFIADQLYVRNAANSSWSIVGSEALSYLALSTTIGDYTTPSNVIDPANTLDSGVETGTLITKANDVINITFSRSTTIQNRSIDIQTLIGAAVHSTAWVCRFKYTISTQTTSTGTPNGEAYTFFLMSDLDGSTGIIANKDSMGMSHLMDIGSLFTINAVMGDAANPGSDSTLVSAVTATTYYIEMIRNGDDITVKLFSNSGYTTLVATATNTLAGITGLRYFIIGNYNNAGNFNGTGICQLDDFAFDNGVTTFGTAEYSTSFTLANEIFDGNTATSYQTSSMSGPSVYADLGSNTDIVGIALNLDRSLTTVTEIKIRASTDTTFTDAENIAYLNVSDFTDDTYRFLANNFISDRRYVQIIGVGTGVLSINELKVRYGVGNDKFRHKHRTRLVDSADSFVDSN